MAQEGGWGGASLFGVVGGGGRSRFFFRFRWPTGGVLADTPALLTHPPARGWVDRPPGQPLRARVGRGRGGKARCRGRFRTPVSRQARIACGRPSHSAGSRPRGGDLGGPRLAPHPPKPETKYASWSRPCARLGRGPWSGGTRRRVTVRPFRAERSILLSSFCLPAPTPHHAPTRTWTCPPSWRLARRRATSEGGSVRRGGEGEGRGGGGGGGGQREGQRGARESKAKGENESPSSGGKGPAHPQKSGGHTVWGASLPFFQTVALGGRSWREPLCACRVAPHPSTILCSPCCNTRPRPHAPALPSLRLTGRTPCAWRGRPAPGGRARRPRACPPRRQPTAPPLAPRAASPPPLATAF